MGLAPHFRPSRTGGPACPRAVPTHLASAQPSARWLFSRAPRPSLRHAATASGSSRRVATTCRRRPPRGSRGLTPRPRAHAPAFTCWCPRARSLPPAFPLLPSRAESSSSAARRARSSAGVELPHHRAILRLLAPATPPRLPSSRARACSAFRAQGELPRASPPTAMAPPCSAAMEAVFLLPSSLA